MFESSQGTVQQQVHESAEDGEMCRGAPKPRSIHLRISGERPLIFTRTTSNLRSDHGMEPAMRGKYFGETY